MEELCSFVTPGEKLAMHKKDSSSYDGQRNDQDRSHPYPLFVIILFQILVHKKRLQLQWVAKQPKRRFSFSRVRRHLTDTDYYSGGWGNLTVG